MKHASDLGNQHNGGPDQDQIFDNPSALHSGAKSDSALGGTDEVVCLSFPPSDQTVFEVF